MQGPEFDLPSSDWKTGRYLEWYVQEPLVAQSPFLSARPEPMPLPSWAECRDSLPKPFWDANPIAIEAYWKAWELAWGNLRAPVPGSGFVSNSIDTAFNDCLFLWDSVAILRFGQYGERAFPFHATLDNFYAKQHRDGYICRELHFGDGSDQWHRGISFGTGPNILAWAEWKHFQQSGDKRRLRDVYTPLAAYHRWTRKNRTWPDGSYWTTGLGSGMDNMERVPNGTDTGQEHGWMTWTDATFQAILSARVLARMAQELEIEDAIDAREEANALAEWVNQNLWDEDESFYFDRDREGNLMRIKSIAGYWALLADIVPRARVESFVKHLDDPNSFKRHHRIPSLAANHSGYAATGDYWNGAVWAPTNYFVLQGLTQVGQDALAFEIAKNHAERVWEVYESTGTFWENYAPESSSPGQPAQANFVGWSGLPPIAVLLEYIFGLRPTDAVGRKLVWDIRLLDAFGVDDYPLGPTATLSLRCESRASKEEEPAVTVRSDTDVEVEIRWNAGSKILRT